MKGIERLKQMVEGQTDKALLKVVEYLLTRNDMNDKFLNSEKNLKDMCSFVQEEAKRKSEKNKWNCFTDDEVFGWAIHYFDESNESLKIISNTEQIKNSTNVKIKHENKTDGQLTLFDI